MKNKLERSAVFYKQELVLIPQEFLLSTYAKYQPQGGRPTQLNVLRAFVFSQTVGRLGKDNLFIESGVMSDIKFDVERGQVQDLLRDTVRLGLPTWPIIFSDPEIDQVDYLLSYLLNYNFRAKGDKNWSGGYALLHLAEIISENHKLWSDSFSHGGWLEPGKTYWSPAHICTNVFHAIVPEMERVFQNKYDEYYTIECVPINA